MDFNSPMHTALRTYNIFLQISSLQEDPDGTYPELQIGIPESQSL